MPNPRATLYDVARAAGVSHMTVSRVVRGDRRVAPATREKVQAAITSLNYHPDPVLSALASYRSSKPRRQEVEQIAFLDFEGNTFTQSIFQGAQLQARDFGYGLTRFQLRPVAPELRRCARIIYSRGIRGLLVSPTSTSISLADFRLDQLAAVTLGAVSQEPPLHSVGMDYFQGMMLAMEHLAERGFERPGLVVFGRLEARSAHRWLGAFLAANHLLGKNPIEPLTDEPLPEKRFRAWCREYQPDVILTIFGEIARWLAPVRPRPELVFLNNFSAIEPYARIELDPAEIGCEAVRVLHPLLMRMELGIPALPKWVGLQCRWRDAR